MPAYNAGPFRTVFTVLALTVGLLAAGCGGGSPSVETPVESPPIENSALGIALEGAPAAGFELVTNEGSTLRLERPAQGSETAATVDYGAGEPQVAGVNLVDAVNAQKAEIEGRPDGKFFGQVELMSHFGTAYITRGRYSDEGGETLEETRLFCVHPGGDRLLWVTYRYVPVPGDLETRRDQAMAALGLVEPFIEDPEVAASSE